MQINESIELIEGMPVAYIKPLNSLVISDTHLGYEGQMSMSGTLIPTKNLSFIEDIIEKSAIITGADRLIVTGDLKNDFSDLKYHEKKEVGELIEFCEKISIKLILIKGNHDNYLDRIKNNYNVDIIKDYLLENGFYITHGDELPKCKADTYIIGHEHPSIIIYKQVGHGEKMKSFLYGYTKDGSKLLVLPACSIFATGSNINEEKKDELLSPFLKEICDVDDLNAICISEGENLNFGKIRDLRDIIV